MFGIYGLEILAVMYALPYALLMWGLSNLLSHFDLILIAHRYPL